MWTKKKNVFFLIKKKKGGGGEKKWKWESGHMGGKAFRGEIKAGRTEKWLLSSRHNNLNIRGAGISQSDSWWSRRWGKGAQKLEKEEKPRARVGGVYGVIWATWFPLDHRLFIWEQKFSLRCLCSPWCPTNCSHAARSIWIRRSPQEHIYPTSSLTSYFLLFQRLSVPGTLLITEGPEKMGPVLTCWCFKWPPLPVGMYGHNGRGFLGVSAMNTGGGHLILLRQIPESHEYNCADYIFLLPKCSYENI